MSDTKWFVVPIIVIVILFLGLIYKLEYNSKTKPYYIYIEYRPINGKERECTRETTNKLLSTINVTSLSGMDQDWDDIINTTKETAKELCCLPRHFEYINNISTGNYKEVNK